MKSCNCGSNSFSIREIEIGLNTLEIVFCSECGIDYGHVLPSIPVYTPNGEVYGLVQKALGGPGVTVTLRVKDHSDDNA